MKTAQNNICVAIVDDHKLFREALAGCLKSEEIGCEVVFEASDGNDLQAKLTKFNAPDIVLLDIEMPGMGGFETAVWLNENHPAIRILVVSMIERDETIVRMIQLGVNGYITKSVDLPELNTALKVVYNNSYYYSDAIQKRLLRAIRTIKDKKSQSIQLHDLNDREKAFLALSCSDLTYQEIADKMFLSIKTVDGYRDSLFKKFGVRNRCGLIVYAFDNGLFNRESDLTR